MTKTPLSQELLQHLRRGHSVTFNMQRAHNPSRDLRGVDLSGGTYVDLDFSFLDLRGANFNAAKFRECNFWGSNLEGLQAKGDVVFDRCIFDIARTKNTIIGPTARFVGCRFLNTRVDTYVYAILRGNGLSEAELMHVEIDDEYVRLRLAFGGINSAIHALAIAVFLAPYLWFLASAYAKSEPRTYPDAAVSIISALIRFVASGGATYVEWQPSAYALVIFAAVCIYNVVRANLVWNTRKLEHQALVTLRTSVNVPRRLMMLRKLSNVLLWVYLPVIVLHTLNFLTRRIPIV